MPIVLDDEMLIPPSMRRTKRYYATPNPYDDPRVETTIIESPSMASTTTIELPPHRPFTPPRSPVVVHEDYYAPLPTEIECSRGREYVIHPAGRSAAYHKQWIGGGEGFGGELDMDCSHGHGYGHGRHYYRARSVGPVLDYDSYSDDYYLEDGTRHGIRHHHHGSPHGHRGRHGHRVKHFLGDGAGLVGVHSPREHGGHGGHLHRRSSSSNGHKGRHLAEAAGLALGAKKLMKHRSLSRPRRSPSPQGYHHARHLAEAGIAAAGLKHALNHRRSRSHSLHRRLSSDSERHPGWNRDDHKAHRRAKHLAEAGLGIAVAGAAKELHDRRKHHRSSSQSSSGRERNHNERHIASTALGATAAGLAHHKHAHHRRRSSSASSYSSSSDDGNKHRGRKIAGAAGLAAKALYDRQRNRSRSSSTSSSLSDGGGRRHRHRLGKAALGAAATAGLKHHHDRRSRSRSSSRERRNHVDGLKKAGYTMAGALAEKHRREQKRGRSLSADGRRYDGYHNGRHGGHHIMHGNLKPGQGFVESESIHSSPSRTGTRSRCGSHGGGVLGKGTDPSTTRNIGEAVAYKIGEAVAEGLNGRRRSGSMGHRR
ncbi:hypothetical protein C7212DRAFT_286232 [Tuber magnatum]|uniref:DUF3824 domain-containing protein n=1 Tax=Tuber magnatum TaxID=42249 RepID=A0A317SE11_9PEZI|nr:hypothetical protein C7212DRAFT_286232 [Tuber magnatum]